MLRVVVLVAALVPATAVTSQEENLGAPPAEHYLYLQDDYETGSNAIVYTGCGDPDIWHECIDMTLGCDKSGGWFELLDGGYVASRLLDDETLPQAIIFAIGPDTFHLDVWQFRVWFNDMDGGWVVRFDNLESQDMFDAARLNRGRFTATIGGVEFDLTPRDADRALLHQLAATCGAPTAAEAKY